MKRYKQAALIATLCFLSSPVVFRAELFQHSTPSSTSGSRSKPCLPVDTEGTLAKAGTLLQQAQYSEVVSLLESSTARSCDPRVALLLAAAFEGIQDVTGARNTLEQAHRTWPENNSIAASLAREDFTSGDHNAAAEALLHFHPTADTPWRESSLAAVVLLAAHQLVPAQKIAEAAYQNQPSLQSLLLLANTLQLEGRYKDVLALLESQRNTYQQAPAFLITATESEYDAKMFDVARRDVESAIRLDPTLYQAHYLLGNILLSLGVPDQAAAEYRTSIQLAPKQPRTYYQLALALRAQQQEAAEESVLNQAIALDEHYALAHSELGRTFLNQGRLQEAVTQLKASIAANPASEQAYYLLAKAYDRLGDTAASDAMTKRLADVRAANHKAEALGGAGGKEPGASSTP